jgi:hypothetical protein
MKRSGGRVPATMTTATRRVILHCFHERIDRFTAEIVGRQRVRLVDEQRSAHCLLDHLRLLIAVCST